MNNRHEFNLYLSANHQFNNSLILTRNLNSYLDNNSFNICINNFNSSDTLIARFIQSNNISVSQIYNTVKATGSFVNTNKMEIKEDSISVRIVPVVQFTLAQSMSVSSSPILSEKFSSGMGFIISNKFEEDIQELMLVKTTTSFNNMLNLICGSGISANYYLVSDWDSYSASSLDTKTITEMEYAYV